MSPSHPHDYETASHPDVEVRTEINRIQQLVLLVGAGALGLCLLVALVVPSQREQFFRSYLFAYVFWLGLALGCTSIALLHNMTGGGWGQAGRRILEAGSGTMILMAVLALPIALAPVFHHVYGWAGAGPDPHLGPHKAKFFELNFVLARGVAYFAVWLLLSGLVVNGARRIERTSSYADHRLISGFSAVGLILYVLTLTLATLDWMMSLSPNWMSTVYGLLFVCGQALSAFSFCVLVLALMMRHKPLAEAISLPQFADLGTFMFGFTILWAYMSLAQFLITWMGNLRSEMNWYVQRTTHGWQVLAGMLILFQFLAPFLALMVRRVKRTPELMMFIAVGVICMRFVDIYWIIKPSFPPYDVTRIHQVSWMDLFTPVGIGGLFLWGFLWRLKAAPLTPPPLITEVTAVEARAAALVGATEYGAAIIRRKGPVP